MTYSLVPQDRGTSARPCLAAAACLLAAALLAAGAAHAAPRGFLETLHRNSTLTSTVPANGDQNPYAIAVAPVSLGAIQKDDVLVDNFNNSANLQGVGTTIVIYRPSTGKMIPFAQIPHQLHECPGGVGLGTAMTMLKSGWVIVGSTPSNDGTTGTKGAGCMIVLDSQGKVASVIANANINDPWGNMAVVDKGSSATLFVSNAGFGVGSADGHPPVVNKATVLRLELSIPDGKPPVLAGQTVVASGFGEQADKGVFLVGPTGLALGADGTLYVSNALANSINAIPDALTRQDSAGLGRVLTKDGLMQRPLALAMAPNGHLLATNALDGRVVEIDPVAGKQLYAKWIDTDQAQTPPGNGDLFGIAMTPQGDGFYYVEDDVNTLVLAK